MSAPRPTTALLGLVGGALCIAMAPIFVRLSDVGPTAAAFWRVALAAPMLWCLWLSQRDRLSWQLLWPGVFFGCDLAVWHQAITLTSVANATLLPNLQPVFVAAVMVLWFKQRLLPMFWLGLVCALSGSVILVGSSLNLGGEQWRGDALGVLTAVFYAAYLVSVARLRGVHGALAIMWVASATAAVLLLPVAASSDAAFLPRSIQGWLVLAGLAIVSHVCGQGLIAWSLAWLPTSFSAVTLLVQPVAAAGFAWLLLSEPLGAQQALGGAVVLAGIALCRLATLPRAHHDSQNGRKSSSNVHAD